MARLSVPLLGGPRRAHNRDSMHALGICLRSRLLVFAVCVTSVEAEKCESCCR